MPPSPDTEHRRVRGQTVADRAGRPMQVVITLIGIHSCTLGVLMLFVPGPVLQFFGFAPPASLFFPAQSGVFLLILGTCYLLALKRPSLEVTIPISKVLAVTFLTVYAALFPIPRIIWAANAGDALMLAAFAGAQVWRRRGTSPGARLE